MGFLPDLFNFDLQRPALKASLVLECDTLVACKFAASPGPSSQPPAAKPRKARKTTPRRELNWSSDKATLTARDVEGAVRLLIPSGHTKRHTL
ncbi:hypothetical protein WJX72_010702 [[Myrmecia] bisecta]|uniref:Uncharacterized protein n=1 Tax=[Myrmecia] bisecta TaxID=41462 RepID=A0AAW1Q3I7_9CHLO